MPSFDFGRDRRIFVREARAARLGLTLATMLAALLPAPALASHSQTELISTGPNGGNGAIGALFVGASADGARAFFTTTESLVASDTDNCPLTSRPCFDIYERSGGTTTVLSTGPLGGNGEFDAGFQGASPDGRHVFFATTEQLVPEDTDNMCGGMEGLGPCSDLYERFDGTTSLVSTGPGRGNGPFARHFAHVSDDGARTFFGASDQLAGPDSDQSEDLYQRAGGATTLVSTGSSGGNGAVDALFSGASADGSRVFFRTAEALVGSDTDSVGDVYERFAGATTLISTGPTGGNGALSSAFEAVSANGSRVFFSTEESLVGTDTDSAEDLYERSGGATSVVSTGASGNGAHAAIFEGISTDGARVFFRTRSPMTSADSDTSIDLYERSGNATTLVSSGAAGGNGSFDVHFAGASDDGTRVFFTTRERLVALDTDDHVDVYERFAGATTLISTSSTTGNGAFDAYFAEASDDGTRVFFTTLEPLLGADTDTQQDIYERQAGTTTLVSTGPRGGNGPSAAFFASASDDGTRVFFHTGEQLVSGDTDTQQDIYASTALVGYARPRAATPTRARLVPAFGQCSSGNGAHGPPLVAASCGPPAPASAHLTVGTADSNGQPTNSNGYVMLQAICSPPAPNPSPPCSDPGEQGDLSIEIGITDVRRQSDLSDYGGELQAILQIRMTDRLNGASLSDPGTVTDAPFSIPVPCTPTMDGDAGSSCNLTTTADAVLAGIVVEGKRSIWQLGQVEVRDGGADGDADTAPNTPFLQQGLFAP